MYVQFSIMFIQINEASFLGAQLACSSNQFHFEELNFKKRPFSLKFRLCFCVFPSFSIYFRIIQDFHSIDEQYNYLGLSFKSCFSYDFI